MTETMIKTLTSTKRLPDLLTHCQHVRTFPGEPDHMVLQIRSFGRITDYGDKKWYCYSSAQLDLAGATQLRAALDEWIAQQGGS